MKNVGLISDTHIPTRAEKIPLKVFEIFQDADFIIHAGDLVRLEVLKELEQLAPVLAVHGNMDGMEIRGKLPKINTHKVYGWKIGVTHDPGTLLSESEMRRIAEENNFQVLVYGHTHRPNIEWQNNMLFINPGSPTNPSPPLMTKSTVGMLKITREKIEPQIFPLEK